MTHKAWMKGQGGHPEYTRTYPDFEACAPLVRKEGDQKAERRV
jgi:hypothetical protein